MDSFGGILWNSLFYVMTCLVIPYAFSAAMSWSSPTIRNWLKAQKDGLFRRMYVRMFVEAVGRQSRLEVTEMLASLWTLALGFLLMATILLLTLSSAANKVIDAVEVHKVRSLESGTPPKEAGSEQMPPNTIEDELAELRKQKSQLSFFFYLEFFGVVVASLFWMRHLFLRGPYILYRLQFEINLERFMDRIQILASKPELAKLTEREILVTDEQTARDFVDAMKEVADRHNLGKYVEPFLLWE